MEMRQETSYFPKISQDSINLICHKMKKNVPWRILAEHFYMIECNFLSYKKRQDPWRSLPHNPADFLLTILLVILFAVFFAVLFVFLCVSTCKFTVPLNFPAESYC